MSAKIHIADAFFIEKYGIEWAGFTSAERRDYKFQKCKELAQQIAAGEEIDNSKGYIEIEL